MIKRISCKPVLELRQSSPISRGLYHVVQIVDLFQSNTNTWPASIEISFEPSGVNLLVFGDLLFGQKSLGHLGMHFRWNIKWVESAFRHNCSQLESCQLHFRPRWNSGWKIWYFRTRQVFSKHRAVEEEHMHHNQGILGLNPSGYQLSDIFILLSFCPLSNVFINRSVPHRVATSLIRMLWRVEKKSPNHYLNIWLRFVIVRIMRKVVCGRPIWSKPNLAYRRKRLLKFINFPLSYVITQCVIAK